MILAYNFGTFDAIPAPKTDIEKYNHLFSKAPPKPLKSTVRTKLIVEASK